MSKIMTFGEGRVLLVRALRLCQHTNLGGGLPLFSDGDLRVMMKGFACSQRWFDG